jgi:chitosanase
MLTPTQKQTAQSILNIFETGVVRGDYGKVTVIQGDTGHLTFGRSQTTLGSGNLFLLLEQYCSNHGARIANRLQPYLAPLQARDISLDTDRILHNILRATADDPVMRDTQDLFFDRVYWQPAARAAEKMGIHSPLGISLVYDGYVHGSWGRIRDRTNQQAGTLTELGEQQWLQAYVRERRFWLAGHTRADLRATVYRMDAFQRFIDLDCWGLELPLVVRGAEISIDTLAAVPPGCYDGPQPGTRILALQSPLQRGLDVRLVQLGLSDRGGDIRADGVFGKVSAQCIRQYQEQAGLPITGVADIPLIAQLCA